MKLLIAGCGELGITLGLRLCAAGHTVHGLRRRGDRIPAPIQPIIADLADPATLTALPPSVDSLVYTATPGAFSDSGYEAAYVNGLRNILDALPDAGRQLQRAIFVSSTSVYGDVEGDWVTEDTPTRPTSFSGRRLLQAEAIALGLPQGLVVRFGGIYGPGRERMLRKVRNAEPVSAEPPRWTNRIHRDDCVGVLEHLLHLQNPESVYLGVDDHPCPMHEVTDWLATQLALPKPPRGDASEATARGGNKRCSNRRLRVSGYRFVHPDFRSGYGEMLRQASTDDDAPPPA
ncbi:nucleoside-diphosphate-sugar epimerase [Natronocella acetinitrilica]|uniref:Nucleoside-diphosphate-sugar epimerase n=1 Tax=Natronocella acetinitrilica TaxID=414046 RepID=A0AAE3KBQ2_9GAMM|nr:SDR family oxidoreductase [Natronocella acetinitrilica]MCP1674974.1 nucleoside-diphosphate-sugar epimerase [Natronocella acetinitrilica]